MASMQRGWWRPATSFLVVGVLVGSVLVAAAGRALAEETVLSTGVADASGAQGAQVAAGRLTVPRSGAEHPPAVVDRHRRPALHGLQQRHRPEAR